MASFPDVIVVGGGPSGSSASICLQRMGYSTRLVDGGGSGFKVGESLPAAAKLLLHDLGASRAASPETALISYGNQSAWGSADLVDTDFIRDPHGCGWHVNRRRFDSALREVAAEAGVDISMGMRVRDPQARWIVDCTGRAASIARRFGAKRVVRDHLAAAVAVFQGQEGDQDSRTLVESAPDGWWYTSLVPEGRRIVAFHADAGCGPLRVAGLKEGFLKMMNSTVHVRDRLQRFGYEMSGKPHIAAAYSAMLDRCWGAGWIAAGDAAIALDPLASQGILTALYSGREAADTIARIDQGDAHAGALYDQTLRNVFAAHLRNREPLYQQERRWPDTSFWRSRQGPA